jgi:hypothetical protein
VDGDTSPSLLRLRLRMRQTMALFAPPTPAARRAQATVATWAARLHGHDRDAFLDLIREGDELVARGWAARKVAFAFARERLALASQHNAPAPAPRRRRRRKRQP